MAVLTEEKMLNRTEKEIGLRVKLATINEKIETSNEYARIYSREENAYNCKYRSKKLFVH